MNITVSLYKTIYRKNDINRLLEPVLSATTCQFVGYDGHTVDRENPTIQLYLTPTADIMSANYMYIAEFKRYYWCHVRVSDGGALEIVAHVDVLTSFKDEILASPVFVNRTSDANHFNIEIKDELIRSINQFAQATTSTTTIPEIDAPFTITDGCYLVRTVGGPATPYALTYQQFTDLMNAIKGYQPIIDVARYIVSIQFAPVAPATLRMLTVEKIQLGNQQVTVSGDGAIVCARHITFDDITLNIPSAYYNDFRDYDANFTTVELEIFGNVINIQPTFLRGGLTAKVVLDTNTCAASVNIYGEGGLITRFNKSIGAAVSWYDASTNITGILTGALGVAGNVVTQNYVGAVGQGVGTVMNAFVNPTVTAVGTDSSISEMVRYQGANVTIRRFASTELNPERGRPCMEWIYALNINGYFEGDCHIVGAMSDNEARMIEALIREGVFNVAVE